MGVSLEFWRMKIGCFSSFRTSNKNMSNSTNKTCSVGGHQNTSSGGTSRTSSRFLAVICLMLVIGGIEMNPGPASAASRPTCPLSGAQNDRMPSVILKNLSMDVLQRHMYGSTNTEAANNSCSSFPGIDSEEDSQDAMELHYSASDDSDHQDKMDGFMTDVNSPDKMNGFMTDMNSPDKMDGFFMTDMNSPDKMDGFMTDVNSPDKMDGFMTDMNSPDKMDGFMTDMNSPDKMNGFMTDMNSPDKMDGFMTDMNSPDKMDGFFMTDVNSPDKTASDFLTDFNSTEFLTDVNTPGKRVRFAEPLSSSSDSADTLYDKQKGCSRVLPIKAVTKMQCCRDECTNRLLEDEPAKRSRSSFEAKTLKEQANWIKTYLADHFSMSNERYIYMFVIGLQKVCCTAWRLVNGITKSRFYVLKKEFEAGMIYNLKANFIKVGDRSMKVNKSMTWLGQFASEFGDKMPDSKNTNLPSSLSKHDVYERMSEEMIAQGDEPCSKATFLKVWRKERPDIVIPKENRFGHCNTCTKFKLQLQSTHGKAERRKIQMKRDAHIKFQNEERKKYYKHISKAKKFPRKYMSLIIDGMDQNTTSIPRPHLISKFSSSMWKLTCHLVGVVVHGKANHVFIDLGEIPQDSNTTCNILLQTLLKYVGELPPTLYIQMDNCGRENKNQYVFGLCCALVELEVFDRVKISFLPVGHTHEDVDQFFSRISVHLNKFCVATLSKLLELIPSATPKIKVTVERLVNCFDVKSWLAPCLTPIQHHSYPHVFKFSRNKEGKAVMHTRMWASTKEKWSACSTDDDTFHLLRQHPDGSPHPLKSDLQPLRLNRLLQDIKRAIDKELMNTDSLNEWKALVTKLQEEEEHGMHDDNATFPLYDLLSYNGDVPHDNISERGSSPAHDSSDSDPSPVVNLGRKKKKWTSKPIQKSDMLCVYNPDFPTQWPQVGKVVDINDKETTLLWYGQNEGEQPYNPMFITKDKGKRTPYTTTMPLSCVLTDPFQLTSTRRLPKKVKKVIDTRFHDFFE